MKEKLIQKLWNNEELTSDEIISISKSLNESNPSPSIPFNHDETDIFDACGVSKKQAEEVNEKLKNIFGVDGGGKNSAFIEQMEILCHSDPISLRTILIQFTKNAIKDHLARGLFGGMPAGLEGLPDEIRDMIKDKLGDSAKDVQVKVVRGDMKDLSKLFSDLEDMKKMIELKEKIDKLLKKDRDAKEGKDSE